MKRLTLTTSPTTPSQRMTSLPLTVAGIPRVVAVLAIALSTIAPLIAQRPINGVDESQPKSDPATSPVSPLPTPPARIAKEAKVQPTLSNRQSKQAGEWLEKLSSNEFAVRERAAENLLGLGEAVVPLLREHFKNNSNAEVKLRTKTLIKHLNDGDLESRIKAFTNGEDVGFEGWPVFRIMFGESSKSRDLFVELVRNYPELIESFHGTARDRALAMKAITQTLANKQQRLPAQLTVADAVALLLPVTDPAVPLSEEYESKMMMVLRMAPASGAPSDPIIGRSFTGLLNAWLRRSTLANRERVLDFGIQSQLTATYPLATKTLEQTKDPRTLAIAMQVVSRFGRVNDISSIEPFLEDERVLSVSLLTGGKHSSVQLRDAAIAAIAKLHGLPLTELGFPAFAEHQRYGFVYEDLFYRRDNEKIPTPTQQRDAALAKVKQLIKQGKLSEPEKS